MVSTKTIGSLAFLCSYPIFTSAKGNENVSRARQGLPTCSKWQVRPSKEGLGHEPWTHAPYCVPSGASKDKLCVFTDTSFHFGEGVSIISRPELAQEMIKAGLLENSQFKTHSSTVHVKYEAVQKPALGIGLFVKPSQKYQAGEVIMVDYPTLIVPSGSVDYIDLNVLSDMRWRALLQLPLETRTKTRALAKSKNRYIDELTNIFETNAFTHEKAGVLHDIIFPQASNEPQLSPKVIEDSLPLSHIHANLLNSAFTRTNHSTLAMEVIALRDIHEGEEISHSYLDPSAESTSHERHTKLSSDWNFDCRCSICTGDGVSESDKRRREMAKTQQLLQTASGDPAKILNCAETILRLYKQEGMILPKAEYYALAAHACKYLGRREKAAEYAGLAKQHWDVIFGEESRESGSMVKFEREL